MVTVKRKKEKRNKGKEKKRTEMVISKIKKTAFTSIMEFTKEFGISIIYV